MGKNLKFSSLKLNNLFTLNVYNQCLSVSEKWQNIIGYTDQLSLRKPQNPLMSAMERPIAMPINYVITNFNLPNFSTVFL